MPRKSSVLISCVLILWIGMPPGGHAQTAATGSILGVVTDPTGASIPGAVVQIVNSANGATMTAASDEQGKYAIPNVSPGTYTVTTTAQGFRQSIVNGVVVEVTKTTTVNIRSSAKREPCCAAALGFTTAG